VPQKRRPLPLPLYHGFSKVWRGLRRCSFWRDPRTFAARRCAGAGMHTQHPAVKADTELNLAFGRQVAQRWVLLHVSTSALFPLTDFNAGFGSSAQGSLRYRARASAVNVRTADWQDDSSMASKLCKRR